MMLYLFYNGVSHRNIQLFDNIGVEWNKKSFYVTRKSFYDVTNERIDADWDSFFNKCYFPIEKITDIVDVIGYSDISIKTIKNIDKSPQSKV